MLLAPDKFRNPICFACAKPIDGDEVTFCGYFDGYADSYGDIVLHVECADWLSSAMKRDVLEASSGKEVANVWYRTFKRVAP